MKIKIITPIILIIFLIMSITPGNAVNIGDIQDNANKEKSNLNLDILNKKNTLSQLKLLKTQLSSLSSEAQENLMVLEEENKRIKKERQKLLAFRNNEVKDCSESTVNTAADHIVSELQHKNIFASKVITPLKELKNNTIVQVISKEGYIRYIVYDGVVSTEDGKTVVLIRNTQFQSQRYMTLEEFEKEYTGITIAVSESTTPTDMTREIWEIQKNDLKEKLNSLQGDRDAAQKIINYICVIAAIILVIIALITIFIVYLGVNPIGVFLGLLAMKYGLIVLAIAGVITLAAAALIILKYQEIKAFDAQIALIEDEMISLGVNGA